MALDVVNFDAVNWKRLIHAYGLAADTPEHLHNLFSADIKLRNSATYHLESAIIHQGTLYPATPAVVKFIIGSITAPILQEDESEYYRKQIKSHLAWEKKLFESIKPEAKTMTQLEQSLSSRRNLMEGWLGSDKVWTTLEKVLGFIEAVGLSLSYMDKADIIANARILTPEETERLDYLLDNYEDLDDLEKEEFWTTHLTEPLYTQGILDLFNMASGVLSAIKPFTTNGNIAIAEAAKQAFEIWEKVCRSAAL